MHITDLPEAILCKILSVVPDDKRKWRLSVVSTAFSKALLRRDAHSIATADEEHPYFHSYSDVPVSVNLCAEVRTNTRTGRVRQQTNLDKYSASQPRGL